MTNRTAALRYARALLEVAIKEKAELSRIEEDLTGFAQLLAEHPPLEKILLNPAVPAVRKRAVVTELTVRANVSPILAKLLVLLAERDRLGLVRDLLAAYRERLLDHDNVVRAEIVTATALTPDRTRAIENGLARVTGRTIALATRVDPAIIGGVIARIGDRIYDGSVTRQLAKMKERITETI